MGLLDAPDTYDRYEESACPTCGEDVGITVPVWWCDGGHMGVLQ